jgi:hypothetical protein
MIGIVGKVAKIIDVYTVVINRGLEHGVEEDMRFVIYEPGEEIKDPDTDALLGKFEYVKAKVKVVNVQEKFSTAKTNETYSPPGLAIAAQLSQLSRRQELPLDKKMRDQLSDHTLTVEIGDLVRQILD